MLRGVAERRQGFEREAVKHAGICLRLLGNAVELVGGATQRPDDIREEDHAVVAARLDGKWLMLDNRRMVMLEDQ